jgi:predicted ATP-dependent endonuclease of OLD family
MRLTAFRIKNFRSIVDSKWNNLSPDNITSLIGQNESGKTSVLEALKSFYDGIITDDVLRSDLSMPEIACEFDVEDECLDDIFGKFKVTEVISSSIQDTKKVILTRTWINPKINNIEIGGEVVENFYNSLKAAKEESDRELEIIFAKLDNDGTRLENLIQQGSHEIEKTKSESIRIEKSILEYQRQISRARTLEQKENIQSEIDKLQLSIEHNRLLINHKQEHIEKLKEEYQFIYDKVKHIRNAKAANLKAEEARKHIEYIHKQIQNIDDALPILINPKEIKVTQQKLDVLRQQLFQTKQQFEKLNQDASFARAIAANIIEGNDYEESKKKAIQALSMPNDMATREDLGRAFFQYCPKFELFEDFSSLLPNRIDLDDLINENSNAEGFKAAKNFLVIAGVDASFFQQQNNRILKQKIENLNGEITVNFQDFWRQSVGKNNKIKIHFDLEHYDFNHPEKSGKPYLEFWIKDSKERLYPKQRSRGVRWFLSFYLELKATAKLNQKNQVLLIDEPGISLHTRAQEDVLKVFEDIKDDLMILYTTHSPHLIDINKLYRLLAVQRAIEDDDTSESIIYNLRTLSKASADTLSPIYVLMGARFSEQQFIHKYNNIIVEDNSCYYVLVALFKMVYPNKEVYILPATDVSTVPTLANLLLGWKLDFMILLSGLNKSNQVYNTIKMALFGGSEDDSSKKIIRMEPDTNLFDLFSTIDFKNHILHQRVGITESNSEYIENNNLSASLLGMELLNLVQVGKIKLEHFDDESQANILGLLAKIMDRMQE